MDNGSDSVDISNLQNQISNLQEQTQYFQQVLSGIQSSQISNEGIVRAIQALDLELSDVSGLSYNVLKQFNDLKNYVSTLNQTTISPPSSFNLQAKALTAQIEVLKNPC